MSYSKINHMQEIVIFHMTMYHFLIVTANTIILTATLLPMFTQLLFLSVAM